MALSKVFGKLTFSRLQTWLKQLAALKGVTYWMRLGYASKGVIYLIVGLFALGEALGFSVPLLGTEGVLLAVTRQPLGLLLLAILAVGIAGYAFWRFVQALADPEHDSSQRPLRLVQRLGYATSGLSYAGIVYASAEFIGEVSPEQDDTIEDLAAQLLELPLGIWLLALAGLTVVGIGLVYIYGGLSQAYISEFRASCREHMETLATWLGQIGYTARGVAFTVIGAGLLKAAVLSHSEPAGGLQHALSTLEDQPYGRIGLGVVAAGFVAYALYAGFVAIYRRFELR
ncbi:MAG: DUF1206 domain-containing protein [Leptolyngbya sp. SIO4C1]|nr:DUF1206 domain-containing protein [Leptolyngbya sp. SIO4C1]